jgi:hypothetical protein
LAAASYAASDDKGLASIPPVIYALFIADFCNKIGTERTWQLRRPMSAYRDQPDSMRTSGNF